MYHVYIHGHTQPKLTNTVAAYITSEQIQPFSLQQYQLTHGKRDGRSVYDRPRYRA